jgi:hypothetical protein
MYLKGADTCLPAWLSRCSCPDTSSQPFYAINVCYQRVRLCISHHSPHKIGGSKSRTSHDDSVWCALLLCCSAQAIWLLGEMLQEVGELLKIARL